ncbi:hypothetical protein LDENG_00235840, partial [Lucifuga dentata]
MLFGSLIQHVLCFISKKLETRKRSPEKLMSANVSYGNQLFTGTWIIFRKSEEFYDNTQK